jgi:hypothetical protein
MLMQRWLILLLFVCIWLCVIPKQQSGGSPMICRKDIPPSRSHYDEKMYLSSSGPVKKDSDNHLKNSVDPSLVPKTKPEKVGIEANANIEEDDRFYLSPDKMSTAQKAKFMWYAKIEKMTLTDYRDWLLMFKDKLQHLNAFHRANLRIIMRGGELEKDDMPKKYPLPPNSDHEYNIKVSQGGFDNITQPEYLGYQPINYDEIIGGDLEGEINRSIKHLDFVNSDEPMKTWILSREPSYSKDHT